MTEHEFEMYRRNSDKREKVRELVNQLINETNSMGSDELFTKAMFDAIASNHRTLQQGFWRIIFDVAEQYKDARYDMRNEASVKACGVVTDALKKTNLPFI